MAPGKEFVGLVPPKEQRPPSDFNNAPAVLHNVGHASSSYGTSSADPVARQLIRNQLTITTWLCLGAIAQGTLFLAVGRLALVPAVLVVVYKVLVTYLQCIGMVRNPHMDGVLMKKFAAQFPDEAGNYGATPANNGLCVFLIGARSNHPLGAFGPHFKELGDFFDSMAKNLDAHADDFDFLGMTNWTNAGDRQTSPEGLSVAYFRSVEGLHKFAHSDFHRGGWDWWNKGYAQMPHLSIYHEIYQVPKGGWESIYVNSQASGINSTTSRFVDRDSGKTMWASPVVDASKGLLKTSAGRMNRSQADSHEKMGVLDPYGG
ncbi:hypothetical protein LTR53_005494 [Teratosphaeriaceae sp. CCFEE 6253]|nr:hypothetical protein LTR53_005494 [Teratosphaeriaceae sp. CCFEE 6253]